MEQGHQNPLGGLSMDIFKGIRKAERLLDYAWKRHKVLLSNLANADTPGYRRRDVEFKREVDFFKLKRTDPRHIKPERERTFRVFEVKKPLRGNDKNNVSIEEEMAKLSQNRIAYEVYMRMVSGSIEKLNSVIRSGRR